MSIIKGVNAQVGSACASHLLDFGNKTGLRPYHVLFSTMIPDNKVGAEATKALSPTLGHLTQLTVLRLASE